MVVAGDIGGTKTVLGIYTPDLGPRQPVIERVFRSRDYHSLAKILQEFLTEVNQPIDLACFGVAGPVVEGQATVTNLPWVISLTNLREVLQIPVVTLMNDLQAIANAVPILEPADLHTLNVGEPVPGGAIAVVSPGTGLGEAYLTWDGQRYHAHASEGGHTDFAPRNALEVDLLNYLSKRMGHVSYEWVCSGLGIPNIYAYLKDTGYASEPAWLTAQLRAAVDPTPVIVSAALSADPPCELCAATLRTFVSILGAEAGNMALKVLSTGGVYIGGGIPPRILPALEHHQFLESFLQKGRMSRLLLRMPVHVILNAKAAVLGAARCALEQSRESVVASPQS